MTRCKHDRVRAQRNARGRQPNNVSSSYPQDGSPSRSHRYTHSWQAEVVHRPGCGMDNVAIHVQGVRVCSASEDERSLRPGPDPEAISDMTAELQSLSTQLKRRFGEHDETDLAREIEFFERDQRSHQRCHYARNCLRGHGAPRIQTAHRCEYQSAGYVQGAS